MRTCNEKKSIFKVHYNKESASRMHEACNVTDVDNDKDELGSELARKLFRRATMETLDKRLEAAMIAEVVNVAQHP